MKTLAALSNNVCYEANNERHVLNFKARMVKKRVLRAWQGFTRETRIVRAPTHGTFLLAAYRLLRLGFQTVMEKVFQEFPQCRIEAMLNESNLNESTLDPSGIFGHAPSTTHPLLLIPNYVQVSTNPHYFDLYIEANQNLARHLMRTCFNQFKANRAELRRLRKRVARSTLRRTFEGFKATLARDIRERNVKFGLRKLRRQELLQRTFRGMARQTRKQRSLRYKQHLQVAKSEMAHQARAFQ